MKGKIEFVCLAGFLALGILSVVHGLSLPLMGPVATCPGLFPVVIGVLLTALSGGLFLRKFAELCSSRTEFCRADKAPEESGGGFPTPASNSLTVIIGMLAAYVVLLPVLHFIPASLLFGTALSGYALRRITVRTVLVMAASVLTVYFTFSLLFRVILP